MKYSSIELRNTSNFLPGQEMNSQVKQQKFQMVNKWINSDDDTIQPLT